MKTEYITPAEAARLKDVSRAAIYLAIKEGRLNAEKVLGRVALKKAEVQAWTPMRYAGRPGVTARRPKGIPMSEETRARISASQKARWARRKKKK